MNYNPVISLKKDNKNKMIEKEKFMDKLKLIILNNIIEINQ
jgi:hypothetical protein